MPVRLAAVTFDAHDPARLAAFWAGVLDRSLVAEGADVLLPGTDTQLGLRFVAATTAAPGPSWLHLHLTSASPEDQRHTVEAVVAAGGRHVDVGQRPEEGHVVLADPEGNELCVIEPGNRFLAGCGFLGEIACDGTRDVGLFWRDALTWPLVWDHEGETAVQSPRGGTKVAWGGPPVAAKDERARQRFDLEAPDPAAEAARLVALGARELGDRGGRIELADPDGNPFAIRPDRTPTS
jgi:catechol 2,3-dioxygenase-like lactoylglutathione lyase family enzyme